MWHLGFIGISHCEYRIRDLSFEGLSVSRSYLFIHSDDESYFFFRMNVPMSLFEKSNSVVRSPLWGFRVAKRFNLRNEMSSAGSPLFFRVNQEGLKTHSIVNKTLRNPAPEQTQNPMTDHQHLLLVVQRFNLSRFPYSHGRRTRASFKLSRFIRHVVCGVRALHQRPL